MMEHRAQKRQLDKTSMGNGAGLEEHLPPMGRPDKILMRIGADFGDDFCNRV